MMSDLFWWKITVNVPYRHPNTETKKILDTEKIPLTPYQKVFGCLGTGKNHQNATDFCGSSRSTERAHHDRGQSLKEVPQLVMSIGAARNHIYQSNVFGAQAGHPLFRRALTHVLMISNAWALKNYLGFCIFLWQELREDLGRNPGPGWNYTRGCWPVFLFQGKFRRKEKEVRFEAKIVREKFLKENLSRKNVSP